MWQKRDRRQCTTIESELDFGTDAIYIVLNRAHEMLLFIHKLLLYVYFECVEIVRRIFEHEFEIIISFFFFLFWDRNVLICFRLIRV